MSPPARSNLPTTMLTTSTSHDANVPNSWLHSPMRPYTAPDGAAANSRARRRMVSAGTRQNASTDSGVNAAHTSRTIVDALHLLVEVAERRQAFGEQHVAHRKEERGVGAGEDRHPLVGVVGGAGATRVDHDDLAAARADAVELTEHVGAREERTARRLRVAAHADEVVGALDVGRRDLPHVPVHQDARDVLGPLVDGARRVDVRHARLPDEQRHVATEREAVADRVADERGRRGDAVAVEHTVDQLLTARERVVPRHLAPRVAVAHHGLPQTVGIVVEVPEGRALGTQVALRPHVVAIASDQLDVLVLDVDLQSAHALTQRTRHEMSLHQSNSFTRPPTQPTDG